jgi:hypothetical protein
LNAIDRQKHGPAVCKWGLGVAAAVQAAKSAGKRPTMATRFF